MRSRGPYCRARFPGISPVVCDVTQWRNWVMSRQRETPRGAPRTVPSSSGKRNTVLIATLTERGFFSFVEATSHFLGSCEKLCRVSLSFWNVIRLPVTRSVGLKGQGGPGVSETGGGARDVIDRRHEASPRVTERPSATLRLRHPGAPAPDKKDPHQLVFASLLSRAVVGGVLLFWAVPHLRWEDRTLARAFEPGRQDGVVSLSQVCHVTIPSSRAKAQGRTPLGSGPSSSGEETPFWSLRSQNEASSPR